MLNPPSQEFQEYQHIWAKHSEWAVYRATYVYQYLCLNPKDAKTEHYSLWQKVAPSLHQKPFLEIKKYLEALGDGWHRVRTMPAEEVARFEGLCASYSCHWKIESEEVVDYDIAHVATAESLDCPQELFEGLVQYAIKRGIRVIRVE